MSSQIDYRFGTPSIEEWDRMWKSAATDPDVSNPEYDRVYEEFEKWLCTIGNVGFQVGSDFYFRGDNYGDRTQYLEIVNPDALRMEALLALQGLLRNPAYSQWRILIPTYIGTPRGIVVYPKAMVIGKPSHELSSIELSGIISRMKERKDKKRKRSHGIE